MEREELFDLVGGIRSDTLIACKLYDALGIPRPIIEGKPKRRRRKRPKAKRHER